MYMRVDSFVCKFNNQNLTNTVGSVKEKYDHDVNLKDDLYEAPLGDHCVYV